MEAHECLCRGFEALHTWNSRQGSELRVTGEVRCTGRGDSLTLARHEAQGFNELDLLLTLVVTPGEPGAEETSWLPVEYRESTETPFATVTVTDCGVTTVVQDVR